MRNGSTKQKYDESDRALKQLNIEISKVRDGIKKKVRDAKAELTSLRSAFEEKQEELQSLSEKVSFHHHDSDISIEFVVHISYLILICLIHILKGTKHKGCIGICPRKA